MNTFCYYIYANKQLRQPILSFFIKKFRIQDSDAKNNRSVDVTEGMEYDVSLLICYKNGELYIILKRVYCCEPDMSIK